MNKLTVHQWKSKKVIDLAFECPFEVTHEGEVVFVCVLKEQYIPVVNSVKGPTGALQNVNSVKVPEPRILNPEETVERQKERGY